MTFQGNYGVVCMDTDGLQYLYLGQGKQLSTSEFEVAGVEDEVCLYREDGGFRVSSSGPVLVRLPAGEFTLSAGYEQQVGED